MKFYEEKRIGCCGLACVLCSKEDCAGCHKDGCISKDSCNIYLCCKSKSMEGCWQCSGFPCEDKMFENVRIRAFVRYAKENGLDELEKCLRNNYMEGISYHYANSLKGDYDIFDTEIEIMNLIRYGKINNPYIKCPSYETKKFVLRRVEENDEKDLLECYSDPISAILFNSDNCTSKFVYTSLEEMTNCIKLWINQYEEKYYVRFSIVDKECGKAIGTIEIFARPGIYGDMKKVGVFRLDLASKYEKEEYILELLKVAEDKFYDDFRLEHIITKAVPEAKERIAALKKSGYMELEPNVIMPFSSYYIRVSKKCLTDD